jgi:glycosyltransferase involved in cell wall biosynthesis
MQVGKVTIAIPTRNRAELLRLSIASALAQTYGNLEVFISNNASNDHTASVIEEFSSDPRVRVIHHPVGLTMVENWNACLSEASGEFFLLLSDDDLLEPEAISEMTAQFKESTLSGEGVGIVYCRGRVIDQNGHQLSVGPSSPRSEDAVSVIVGFFNGLRQTWPCTILFRCSDIVSGYSPAFALATDAAQWMRAVVRHGSARFVDCVLASYRVHENISLATPIRVWQAESLALAEFAIEELRAAGLGAASDYCEIRRAAERFNINIIPHLLARRCRGKRLALLSAYLEHWRDFASLYGLDCAARGLVTFYAPGLVRAVGAARRRLFASSQ